MRYSMIYAAAVAVMMMMACTEQKQQATEIETIETEEVATVHALPVYHLTDSARLGSHRFTYTIDRVPLDSADLVVDEEGVSYRDNRYTLTINRDGAHFFTRNFTKRDFRPWLTDDFQQYGIIDGMRYYKSEEGKLYFFTCVSYPDSDMSSQFLLTIGPDGSYTIEPDDTPAEEMIDEEGEGV